MSAVMELYKPIPGLWRIPPTCESRENMDADALVLSTEEWRKKYVGCWSDGQKHTSAIIYVTPEMSPKLRRRIFALKEKFSNCIVQRRDNGFTFWEMPYESLLWRQGWFFTKKFFNKKFPLALALTRGQLEGSLLRNLNFKGKYRDAANEAYHVFMDTFEDGMVFELSW